MDDLWPVWLALAGAVTAVLCALGMTAGFRWGSVRHQRRLAHLSKVEFAEMFMFLDVTEFLRLNLLALIVAPLLMLIVIGWKAALSAFLLVLVAPSATFHWLRKRRKQRLQRQLPDAAVALATALRGGLSLSQALEQVVRHQPQPMAQEFSLMLREHRIGVSLDKALKAMSERVCIRDLDLLVSTLSIARDLGGGLAEALERYAASVRRRLTLEERIRALTAQGRLQGVVMGALPIFLAAALYFIDPLWMQPLFVTVAGWVTLGVILILEVTGFVLIKKIVDIRI